MYLHLIHFWLLNFADKNIGYFSVPFYRFVVTILWLVMLVMLYFHEFKSIKEKLFLIGFFLLLPIVFLVDSEPLWLLSLSLAYLFINKKDLFFCTVFYFTLTWGFPGYEHTRASFFASLLGNLINKPISVGESIAGYKIFISLLAFFGSIIPEKQKITLKDGLFLLCLFGVYFVYLLAMAVWFVPERTLLFQFVLLILGSVIIIIYTLNLKRRI